MITIRIENWSVTSSADKYTPPECARLRLMGEVYGHRHFTEGERISTSYIVCVRGNIVETSSGSVYQLGVPAQEYIKWCVEKGVHVPTEEEPIKICEGKNNV